MTEERKQEVSEAQAAQAQAAAQGAVEQDDKAWQRKVEDKSGRDWSKPKTFKPDGCV